jgi:hypothetical protein
VRRTPVISTNLLSVGYDPASSVLEVEFEGWTVYRYQGVPEPHYLTMISGVGSVGRYFNANVKGRYPCVRIA